MQCVKKSANTQSTQHTLWIKKAITAIIYRARTYNVTIDRVEEPKKNYQLSGKLIFAHCQDKKKSDEVILCIESISSNNQFKLINID